MENKETKTPFRYYRRNLPHFHPKNAIFFLTYRIDLSLPKEALRKINQKRRELKAKVDDHRLSSTNKDKLLFDYFDRLLAAQTESQQWLVNADAAQTVIDSLLYFHHKRYDLICTLVMPNHVHTLLRVAENEFEESLTLEEIVSTHKKYTATQINKILNRKGQFWQHEGYDHVVRDEKELYRILVYILQNPVKAGLVDDFLKWPHYWLNPDYVKL